MIAIGFLITFIGFCAATIAATVDADNFAGFCILVTCIGLGLMVAGITKWLWMVAP